MQPYNPYAHGSSPSPYATPRDDSSAATTVFVYGILGFVLCQIFAPIAWVKGNEYMRTCASMGVSPNGLGVAGRILGIIGTIIAGLSVVILIVALIGSSLGH